MCIRTESKSALIWHPGSGSVLKSMRARTLFFSVIREPTKEFLVNLVLSDDSSIHHFYSSPHRLGHLLSKSKTNQ
jgi:hypothetical protein